LAAVAVDTATLRRKSLGDRDYRLQPARIVLIDNRIEFGHKETLDISA
jgi:hypothetical protein